MWLRRALALILVLQVLPAAVAPPSSSVGPELVYECLVKDDGSANVSAVFRDLREAGTGALWLMVPRNESYFLTTLSSENLLQQQVGPAFTPSGGEYTFYSNLTISYSSPFELSIGWNMTYAALIAEPYAIFFSPAIGYPPGINAKLIVELPSSTTAAFEFSHSPVMRSGNTLVFEPIPHDRVAIAFQVSGSLDAALLESAHFKFRVPKRYEHIGRRIADFYENVTRVLDGVFNTTLAEVRVEFFVPSTLADLPIGGFVPITSAYRLGTIYLNIFYVRTERGYMEAIAAHELIHHYLATSGVSPDVLWFHEGMANYVGIKVSELSGMGGASLAEDLIEEASLIENASLPFVFLWKVDRYVEGYSPYQHYAAAYRIVATIGESLSTSEDELLPGITFFSSLFTNMRQHSVKVTGNDQIGRLIYATANFSKDTFALLTSLGLRVRPVLIELEGIEPVSVLDFGSLVARMMYPILEGPITSAIEIAASEDLSRALMIMTEADNFLANFGASLLVLLFLSGLALLANVRRGEELPPPP